MKREVSQNLIFYERSPDVEAIIKNCRASKTKFCDGYRPAFEIHQNYSTSGEIRFLQQKELSFDEEALALIRFLTPEVYPKSIWIGKKIIFKEGCIVTGYAIITKILNIVLESDKVGLEGPLSLR